MHQEKDHNSEQNPTEHCHDEQCCQESCSTEQYSSEQCCADACSSEQCSSEQRSSEPRSKESLIEKEAKEYKDKYLRLLAEVDNTRKRMQKEKLENTRFAVDNVMADLLQPIDNLENALKFTENMSPEVRNWATGFQMILSQFKDALHNQGIVAFVSVGTEFDPHKHDAVETEETTEHPEGIVIKEFVRGYKSGDRTVRAARVKVTKKPQAPEPKE